MANKAIIVGNLGRDPELQHSPQGSAYCRLSVATKERWKGKDGEWISRTEWHRVVFFGKVAESCAAYLKKGRQVYVEGRLETDKWQDKQGNERYSTCIVGDSIMFLGHKPESGAGLQDMSDPGSETAPPAEDSGAKLQGNV